jgi:hypothetical protein
VLSKFKLILAVVILTCGVDSGIFAEDESTLKTGHSEELAADLKAMQGHWEMKPNPNLRFEWDFVDNHCTMSVFQSDKLVYKQSNDFTLKKEGPVKISEWKGGDILAGERKGQKFDGGRLIYRIEGGRIFNVMGLLENDTLPMKIEVLERVPKLTGK